MTLPRDKNIVVNGRLTAQESSAFDVPVIVNGRLTVSSRNAPGSDRTWVDGGRLAVVTADAISAEAAALVARFTNEPSASRVTLIDEFVTALKAAGVWSKLDALYVMAAADEQAAQRNWIADAYNLTAVGAPSFQADRGYTGAIGKYLDTGLNPSVAASGFTANSGHLGVWGRTSGALSGVALGARQSFSSKNSMVTGRLTGDQAHFAINRNGTNTAASADGVGHFVANRSGAAASQGYKNGVSVASDTAATDAITDLPFFVLGLNQAGAHAAAYLGQLSIAHIGASLSAQEVSALYNAASAYMQAVGAA